MTEREMINAFYQHLAIDDVNYKQFGAKVSPDHLMLRDNVSFDIRNKKPENHFAPYFKIDSIDQAKRILRAVISDATDSEFNKVFDEVMSRLTFLANKDLFFSIYRPDRFDVNKDTPFIYS